jgi:hypothetical protein
MFRIGQSAAKHLAKLQKMKVQRLVGANQPRVPGHRDLKLTIYVSSK